LALARMSLALLLKRVFDIDTQYCVDCGAEFRCLSRQKNIPTGKQPQSLALAAADRLNEAAPAR
jgi:hypothetical protein